MSTAWRISIPASDMFYLKSSVFSSLTGNALLPADAFRIGTTAVDSEDRIIYDAATGKLFLDNDGTGSRLQTQFARLETGLALTYADFFVE